MGESIQVCPSCNGEGGHGVKGSMFGWSTCWKCKGSGKVVS